MSERPRSSRLLDRVTPVGNLLVAQLIFCCCGLTVVLIVPAAVALQRTVGAILIDHENAVLRTFVRELGDAARRYLLVGIGIDVVAVMITISIFFWMSANGPLATTAVLVLIILAGLLIGGYLCALAEVIDGDRAGVREWLAAAYRRLARQPLAAAGGVIIMLTWFLLLSRLPTLALVGSGLVPALLAHWLRRRQS